MWKHFINEYLSFTKKERIGIISILFLILLFLVTPFLYHLFKKPTLIDRSQFDEEISRLQIRRAESETNKKFSKNFDENNYTNYYEPSERNYHTSSKAEVFYFDPNIASANDWKRLGIRDKTIETIQKYLSKGGRFYKPQDISKIWGLRKDDAERLIPYVRIENINKEYSKSDKPNYSKTEYKPSPQTVNINAADTSGFISLPGIGSKLAHRIIAFRDKLGGFYSVDQIKETYGLPDSTFQKIRSKLVLTNPSVKQININTATLDEMKSHPYLRFNLANAIIQYRTQHGNFSSIANIKKIMIVTDEIFNKLSPYLTVN